MIQTFIFIGVTLILLALSLFMDRKKTVEGLKKALKMFLNLLPSLLSILALVSVVLYLTPNELLIKWLGEESGGKGAFIAALLGSISLIPGFIAYPLGGILVKNGVGYPVIAIFITTLMMVGILTFPIEKKFFGFKVALLRNLFCLIGAIVIGISIGLVWSLI